jgi:hypothetical protein
MVHHSTFNNNITMYLAYVDGAGIPETLLQIYDPPLLL